MTTSVWHTQLTPLAFLRRSAEVYPDKTAIVYGDRRHTYREFAAEATRVAHALRGSGIDPGDRVAYLLPNIPEMLVAHFAVPPPGTGRRRPPAPSRRSGRGCSGSPRWRAGC